MKKVVLQVSDPSKEVAIGNLSHSGHKFFCIHHANQVCGFIGASEGGAVIYNMETIEKSWTLSPHDAEMTPTVEYSSAAEAILANLDGYTWYQCVNTRELMEAYLKFGR